MKLKTILLILSVFVMLVVAGCGKPLAGQAINLGSSECVEGEWWYETNGNIVGEGRGGFVGCTEYDSAGQPWCALTTVEKEGKQVYVSGGQMDIDWKYCSAEDKKSEESAAEMSEQPAEESAEQESGGATGQAASRGGSSEESIEATLCGNGVKDPLEYCDGQKNQYCTTKGSNPSGGIMDCNADCTWGECVAASQKESSEVKSGSDAKCIDSDASLSDSYKVKGIVGVKEDYCDGNLLFEQICTGENNGYSNKNCKEYGGDFSCKDGACVGTECVDSDKSEEGIPFGDTSIMQAGTIVAYNTNGEEFTDVCSSDGQLKEWYCGNLGKAEFKEFACYNLKLGTTCSKGACVQTCVDSEDGADSFVKGKITYWDGEVKEDKCLGDTLYEQVCGQSGQTNTIYQKCSELGVGYICGDGVCAKS